MRFAFTEDQLALRDAVRDLLARECPPAAVRAAWDEPAGRVPGLWSRLAEMGVVGALASEGHGGMGFSALDLVLLLEESGRAVAPEPLVGVAAVAIPLLEEIGGDLAAEWLPAITSGEAIVAVGLDGASRERSTADGMLVEDADAAALLLLAAGDEVHAVLRTDLDVVPQRSVDGSRRVAHLDWAPTPATRVAGGARGRALADAAFDRGAFGTAAVLVGLGAAMLEQAVEYAKEREQFGRPIGSFQAVKHHLANAALRLEYARPIVHRAAHTLARGGERARDASMAKAYASEAAHGAARSSLQVHGAIGYTVEHDLHLFLKRTWALEAAWGDAPQHRERVARRVLDGPPEAADWNP